MIHPSLSLCNHHPISLLSSNVHPRLLFFHHRSSYPVTLLLGPLIGAIAAGNSIIIKPSENSMATSTLFSELIPKYLDPHNICVITGAQEQCKALLDLRFDHIFFTGSGKIGKQVALKAAETLTPTTLELGGKCPAVVLDDANFLVVARRIIWAKILNAGQTCIAPDYVLVSQRSELKLINAMRKVLGEFYPSDSQADRTTNPDNPSTPDSRYCKIISQHHFDRLVHYLNHTKGEIVELNLNSSVQPKSPDPDTLRIPLTLIRNVQEDDVLMQDELFGPLLPIVTYDQDHEDIVQCLHRINQSTPLTVYAFSQSEAKLDILRKNTKSGQFVCNDLMIQFAIPGLPFGGVGPSGLGSYRGYYSFLTFTHQRPIVNFPCWADFLLNSRYPPYTDFKFKFMQALLGAGRLKGQSDPKLPALRDPVDLKRLFDPSSSGFVQTILPKFGVLALLFAYYFKLREGNMGQKSVIGILQNIQAQVKRYLS